MWLLQIYFFVVVGNRGSSGRSVTIGGWHTRVSSYLFLQRWSGLVLAEIRLGSRVVYSRDVPIVDRKFLSLTICWKSKETIRDLYGFSCRTYHSLMVAPHCLDGSYSRHKCEMPMLAKIYIILSKYFLHYALVIISKRILFCVVSIF